jgi:two-component system sensor histidine kinase ChvG
MLAVAERGEDKARFLAVVEQEIARSERLLASVREMGRLDAPEIAAQRERVDLCALTRQLVESFRVRDEDGIALDLRLPDRPIERIGSPERYAMLIENLLENAVSFSPPGGTVEVELAEEAGAVRLAVADQGPGVPEAHRTRVFDRFFSYRPGSDGKEHSGLGLAIVKTIAEAQGGGATVENRPEGGARFVVYLSAAGAAPSRVA